MNHTYFPASARGLKDIGWLQSHFFFSFSDFQDPTRTAFGSLLAFNDDFLAAGKGFGLHPHGNMEIISVMLQGSMSHKDSLGYENVVHEDGVQIMSAGSGLRHEEHNVGEGPVNFLQIWITPKIANITPRYQFRSFPKAQRHNRLVTIVSSEEGASHCWINQNAKLSLGLFDAGSTTGYDFNPANKCLFIFVIRGSIDVSGQPVAERDALGIWNTGSITVKAVTDCEYLIIETPINQK
ncbi:pirin family protein [Flaviaesturariibacter amylovorans]|uniref:Pirin family protein n=1 Tax=Flaviaesturariibacter amylovorans TaxID=1084520 RepID=A0ABP8GUR9_9BACT